MGWVVQLVLYKYEHTLIFISELGKITKVTKHDSQPMAKTHAIM